MDFSLSLRKILATLNTQAIHMKFIVKLFPEIMIKSETVRKRFAKILTSNIRNIYRNMMKKLQLCATGITLKCGQKMKKIVKN